MTPCPGALKLGLLQLGSTLQQMQIEDIQKCACIEDAACTVDHRVACA